MDPEAWRSLERHLESVIPVYERVNRLMSLGLVGAWRGALVARLPEGGRCLEVGAGPGQLAAAARGRVAAWHLYDPLPGMLRHARRALDGAEPRAPPSGAARGRDGGPRPAPAARAPRDSAPPGAALRRDHTVGIAENLPFREATFDAVACAFSYRDFLDGPAALADMRRVLRPRGRLLILDVAKPEGKVSAAVRGFYVRRVVPVLGRLAAGRHARAWNGNPYRAFAATYDAFPPPALHAARCREAGFRRASVAHLRSGGAFLLEAEK